MNYIKELKPEHNGKYISCTIGGTKISKAYLHKKNDKYYIIQNEKSGSEPKDFNSLKKLNFKYSWCVGYGTIGILKNNYVKDILLLNQFNLHEVWN